ncbi:helix-turn-helix transcriptional regulator [Aerolutibacter ruishenii]|uniref:Uncharacterized protein n=1 Tax=Aerolutibacter ruishenii TaxID=686800 RepID=A0A562LYM7_9GAMM|nr:hypothetical protein [Lysobacter ruishenii]TWI12710.1 hypothetical protein IP93_01055 [Lysobacter ruishenii]
MAARNRLLGALCATIDGRADATTELILAEIRRAGYWISGDGRIGEGDLATILGMAAGALANRRREGKAPPSYALGGGGHRVTYRVTEVAQWLEAHRNAT